MNRDELIERIRKLRALQQSSNVNEAANAAKIAERLIQEYQLAEAELEADNQAEVTEAIAEDPQFLVQWERRKTNWIVNLTFNLAHSYQCAGIMTWIVDPVTRVYKHGVKLTGRPSDVAMVRVQLAYLVVEIRRLCEASGLKGKAARTSFCMGAVDGIHSAMGAARAEVRAQAQASGSTTALAVIDSRAKLAKETLDKRYPTRRSVSTRSSISNGDAYYSGKRAGASIHTGSSLGAGGSGPRRLGS